MTTERDPDLRRSAGHCIERLEGKSFVDLHQIVAGHSVFANTLLRGLWRLDVVPTHRNAREIELWSGQQPALDLTAERELGRVALHGPDRRHTVGEVEKQKVPDVGV